MFALRSKAIHLGATFINGEVIRFEKEKGTSVHVVEGESFSNNFNHATVSNLDIIVTFTGLSFFLLFSGICIEYTFFFLQVKLSDGTDHYITYSLLVLAAGGLSGKVGELLGFGKGDGLLKYPIPVEPR